MDQRQNDVNSFLDGMDGQSGANPLQMYNSANRKPVTAAGFSTRSANKPMADRTGKNADATDTGTTVGNANSNATDYTRTANSTTGKTHILIILLT